MKHISRPPNMSTHNTVPKHNKMPIWQMQKQHTYWHGMSAKPLSGLKKYARLDLANIAFFLASPSWPAISISWGPNNAMMPLAKTSLWPSFVMPHSCHTNSRLTLQKPVFREVWQWKKHVKHWCDTNKKQNIHTIRILSSNITMNTLSTMASYSYDS